VHYNSGNSDDAVCHVRSYEVCFRSCHANLLWPPSWWTLRQHFGGRSQWNSQTPASRGAHSTIAKRSGIKCKS